MFLFTLHPQKIRIAWIVWVLAVLVQPLRAANLQVSFPEDTVLACQGTIVHLQPVVTGASGPVQYSWNSGATTPNLQIIPTTGTYVFWVDVTADGITVRGTVVVIALQECVWPGDANGDAIANNFDLLTIGRSYQATGGLRPRAHLNWIAQPAPSWTHTFANGVNYVHSDVDGNGLVDAQDTVGILHNYLVPQSGGSSGAGQGIPLFLQNPGGQINAGDSVVIPLILGTASQPANGVYGLALSLDYSAIGLPVKSIRVDFSQGWLGQPGQDLISISKDFRQSGQFDLAVTRTDLTDRAGYGLIASIIITVDDVAGKVEGIELIELSLGHLRANNAAGQALAIASAPVSFSIVMSNEEIKAHSVKIMPDWNNDKVRLEWAANLNPSSQIQIFSTDGKTFPTRVSFINTQTVLLHSETWPSGLLLVGITEPGLPISFLKIFKPY